MMSSQYRKKSYLLFPSKNLLKELLSYSTFLCTLLISVSLITTTVCAIKPAERQEDPNKTSSISAKGPGDTALISQSADAGYSIFHETMVDMTWEEVEQAAKEGGIVLLPIAVIEEHGPHMGCGIDTYFGYLTCKMVRRDLESRGIKTLIAPPFYWGINRTTHVFPGTFTVRPETMKALLHDIYTSLESWGFRNIFNFIAHGDGYHNLAAFEGTRDARKELDINAYCLISKRDAKRYQLTGKEPFIITYKEPPFDIESQKYLDIHAGAFETGLVAAFFPDLVDIDLARTLKPTKLTYKDAGEWLKDARRVTPSGYVGDPSNFNAEEAKEFWKNYCSRIADAIESQVKKQ